MENIKLVLDTNNNVIEAIETNEALGNDIITKSEYIELLDCIANKDAEFKALLKGDTWEQLKTERPELIDLDLSKYNGKINSLYKDGTLYTCRYTKLLFCLIELRLKRNKSLLESDKYFLIGNNSALTESQLIALTDYRVALKNITAGVDTINDYYNLVYPTKP